MFVSPSNAETNPAILSRAVEAANASATSVRTQVVVTIGRWFCDAKEAAFFVMLIGAIKTSDKIEGVGEDGLHFFGWPCR